MARQSASSPTPDWPSAAVAGLVAGLVVGVGLWWFDTPVVETHVPDALGTSGVAVGLGIFAGLGIVLGVAYAAASLIHPLGRHVANPDVGGVVGLGYGLLLWLLAIVVVPLVVGEGTDAIGEIAVTVRAAVAFALLGSLMGVGYPVARTLRSRG